jgi:membrane-bound lytic murein transglycosylase MltF
MSTAPSFDVALAKAHRHVEAELRHLKAFQIPIPAMRRDETLAVRRLFRWPAHGEIGYVITQ